MTLAEYKERNGLMNKDIAKLLGISESCAKRLVNGQLVSQKHVGEKLKELGIRFHFGKKKRGSDFLYQERLAMIGKEQGEIYCYNNAQINEITQYFNEQKIDYYVRHKEFYWIVKWDMSDEEE